MRALPKLAHQPVRTRLAVIMICILLALFLGATLAESAYENHMLKGKMAADAKMFTQVLSSDLTHLILVDDVSSAADVIYKLQSLSALNHVDIFDLDGRLVLHFERSNQPHIPISLQAETASFWQNDLFFYNGQIRYDTVVTGQVSYEISTQENEQLEFGFFQMLLVLIPFALLLVYLTSGYMKHFFSQPLRTLTSSIEEIAVSGRYQFQLEVPSQDKSEFASLAKSFNTLMLKTEKTLQTVNAQQEALEMMAHYDMLTQLPNRILFSNLFKDAIKYSQRTGTQLAICFLDLDDFKFINDTHGHDIGDQVLIEVANRIKQTIRDSDLVSRQGGDEFLLLLHDIGSFEACEETLSRVRIALKQPYFIGGKVHQSSASIGVTLYPDDNNENMDILLRHADHAMYEAKQLGKNQLVLFNTQHAEDVIQTQERRQEVKHAIENNELRLFYQPKVNMRSGKVFGVEALLRWFHPKRGLVLPLDFLGVAEGTELDIQIGEWVMNAAIQQLAEWNKQGMMLEVSINISPYHMQSKNFISQLTAALAKYPEVDSSDIQVEMLESSVIGDVDVIRCIISDCQHKLGVKVALDDFGAGYSSLTYLRNFPVDTIKIDQAFVCDMLRDQNDFSLVEGIISLAKIYGRQVVAEGVETAQHGALLMRIGCDLAQGYGIAKPLPASDVLKWVSGYKPDKAWSSWAGTQWEKSHYPLVVAQSEHIKWVQRIFTSLDEYSETLHTDDLCNHYECQLGLWYYGLHGQEFYGKLPAFKTLGEVHVAVHETGHKIITLQNAGQEQDALALTGELLELKNEVLTQLNLLQQQVSFDDVLKLSGREEA